MVNFKHFLNLWHLSQVTICPFGKDVSDILTTKLLEPGKDFSSEQSRKENKYIQTLTLSGNHDKWLIT